MVLLSSPAVLMELEEFPHLHCVLIVGLNGGSLGLKD